MTDKQIIIDGCDISDCEYYCERFCKQVVDEDGCYVFLCAEDKNCHYKKWQRKEQECEELKIYIESNEQQVKEVETLVMDNDRLINELDQLKAENDELKKDKFYLEREVMQLEKDVKDLNYFAMKLKQTLTEIKEIAEICKCHNADGCYECKYFDDCEVEDEEMPSRDVCKLILQKISEVEDESNI